MGAERTAIIGGMRPFHAVTRLAALLAMLAVAGLATAQTRPHARLFPPEDLGQLESPDRAIWQKPDEIMDALNIADGARVGDVGAGAGWFTVRLARRVGPNGVVYAEDVQPEMLESIGFRVSREGLTNVRTVLGTTEDPMLPDGLDAILIVDVIGEVRDPVGWLARAAAALKPQGRLGIVDFTWEGGGPGPPMTERVAADDVVRDAAAAGLTLLSHETFLTYQFLLVFCLDDPGGNVPAVP